MTECVRSIIWIMLRLLHGACKGGRGADICDPRTIIADHRRAHLVHQRIAAAEGDGDALRKARLLRNVRRQRAGDVDRLGAGRKHCARQAEPVDDVPCPCALCHIKHAAARGVRGLAAKLSAHAVSDVVLDHHDLIRPLEYLRFVVPNPDQ